jgi:hypothetical protein
MKGSDMFHYTTDCPDFWIQLKGSNAGQPLRERIPNSIGIRTDPDVLNPDYLFYTLLYLFTTGTFRRMIRGSVIPYIRQSDITIALIDHWYK